MSIRDLLTFLRPSKASVEPVSRTDDPGAIEEAIIERMRERGLFGAVGSVIKDGPGVNRVHPAPQHPLAPEREPPPLDWDRWTHMQRANFRRGWSFARYAVKSPPPERRMACVFGIVRGAFGICTMDLYICGIGSFQPLNAITHLPSGMGCGLFTDQESAVTACDIASRLADDWETLDPYADSKATGHALDHLHAAWAVAGLTRCSTHAHATADHDAPPIPIWFQDYTAIIMGRPEKLS